MSVIPRNVAAGGSSEEPEEANAFEVVVDRVDHEEHEEHEPDLLGHLALAHGQGATEDGLAYEEEQVSPVQHRDGQEVQEKQVDADHGGEEREARQSLARLLA